MAEVHQWIILHEFRMHLLKTLLQDSDFWHEGAIAGKRQMLESIINELLGHLCEYSPTSEG